MADENSVQLGKVVPSYLGDWVSTKAYSKLDTVVYNNVSYIAVKDVPAGVVPSTDTNSWRVTSRGAIGPKGDIGPQGPQGPKGDIGPQGERGKQVFKSSSEYYDQNSSGHWWSDLSPAVSVDNPPKVGDTIISNSGDIFQVNTVTAGDGGGGGGTFSVGGILGNIKGPQGPKGDMDLSQITVGGRNLLLGTGMSFTGIGDGSTNGNFDSQGGRYYLAGGKKVSYLYNQYGPSGYLTLSFDWVASGSTISGNFNPQWDNTPWGVISPNVTIQPSITNKSGHYKVTVPLSASGYSTGVATALRFRQDNLQGNITISNVKLEAGNIATDWTPAPEDVDSTYVNKSGDTMTGNLTAPQVIANDLLIGFHNVIQVPTTTTKIIDLINNDFIKGRGFWKEQTFIAYNSILSDAPTNDAYSMVKLSTRGSNRTYVEYSDLSGNVWHTTASTNTLGAWVKQANDAEVVHNTGTETVAGDKTLTGNTTLANIKSSNVKTANVKLGGMTIYFRQTVTGVNVYIDGSFQTNFGTSDAYIPNGAGVPSSIDNPRQNVVLNIIGNAGVGGVTTNSPFKLEVLIGTDGAIKYRAKNLRDNDTASRTATIVGAASTFYSLD